LHALRSALRSLGKTPAYAAAAIITIGVGVGACTAVFSIIRAVVFPHVPYAAPDRLVILGATMNRQVAVSTEWLTPAQLELWTETPVRAFEKSAVFADADAVVSTGDGGARRVSGAAVDGRFFAVLGVAPLIGRAIGEDDTRAGAPPAVVLSHAFWRTNFGARRDALGEDLRLGGVTHTVIGVMPASFEAPRGARYWTPLAPAQRSSITGTRLIARLAEGTSFESAAAEITTRYEAAWQADSVRFRGLGLALERFEERARRIGHGQLPLIAAGVLLVFLTALVNLSGLVLARTARRSSELAVRVALGAPALRAIGPVLTELVVLAAAGAVVGLWVAANAVRIARTLFPDLGDAAAWPDLRVLVFAVLVTLLTVVILAAQPTQRLRTVDVMTVLRRGATATTTGAERRRRRLLVAGQVALAVILVAAAGIVGRSLYSLRTIDVGYDVDRLVVAMPEYDFDTWDDARQHALARTFLDRFAGSDPSGRAAIWRYRSSAWPPPAHDQLFAVEGREAPIEPAFQLHAYYEVSSGFFETLGVELLQGRDFRTTDRLGTEPVAIIMESAARAWFDGGPALGRRVRIGPAGSEWLRIVGIVPDLPRLSGFGRLLAAVRPSAGYRPFLFRPIEQAGDVPPINWPRRRCLECAQIVMAMRVAEGGAARTTTQAMAAELSVLAPDLPVAVAPFLEEQMGWSSARMLRQNRLALTGFAAIALGLALLGLYAVVADDVTRRTREIGIRKALGARARDVVSAVARDSVLTAAAGVVAGVAVVILGNGITSRLFFGGRNASALIGTAAADPVVLMPAALAILGVACVTAFATASRAARLDPNASLRAE
jgi:putative ABC transport system permease protein